MIKNTEKGFTLLETLIVALIIGILTVTLIPQVNNFFIKSKETGIRTDFKDFQTSSESYLRETRGYNINISELNKYLDKEHKVTIDGSIMNTTSVDPWDKHYEVEFAPGKIEFASFGKEDDSSVKRYKIVTYYHSGVVDSCTYGFEKHNKQLTNFENLSTDFVCGEALILNTPTPPIVTLNPPSNFAATNIQQHSITLSWDTQANATSYQLKRNGVVIYTGGNVMYLDNGLIANTTYEYTLTAKNATSESSPSVKSVTTSSPPLAIEDGTALHPYLIRNCNDLQNMKNQLSAHYQLANDIDCSNSSTWNSGKGFIPIGNNTTKFTGTLNGDGYKITHLIINRSTEYYIGLFGYIANATVMDVQLENVSIKGTANVGGLIGTSSSNSVIINASVTGNITGSNAQIGGLVGNNQETTITNSYAKGTVKGANGVGGLVGNNANVSSTITNSYATGNIEGSHNVGGLIGYNASPTITDSYATGNVKGENSVGGLVGYNTNSIITTSYATGNVEGLNNVGGLVGYNAASSITNSYARGDINGTNSVGGLAGYILTSSTITKAYATGSVTGSTNLGGLVGYNAASSITNAYYDAQTTGRNDTGKGVGLPTASAKTQTSYTTWDFATIWAIEPSVNHGYPYLKGLKP